LLWLTTVGKLICLNVWDDTQVASVEVAIAKHGQRHLPPSSKVFEVSVKDGRVAARRCLGHAAPGRNSYRREARSLGHRRAGQSAGKMKKLHWRVPR